MPGLRKIIVCLVLVALFYLAYGSMNAAASSCTDTNAEGFQLEAIRAVHNWDATDTFGFVEVECFRQVADHAIEGSINDAGTADPSDDKLIVVSATADTIALVCHPANGGRRIIATQMHTSIAMPLKDLATICPLATILPVTHVSWSTIRFGAVANTVPLAQYAR